MYAECGGNWDAIQTLWRERSSKYVLYSLLLYHSITPQSPETNQISPLYPRWVAFLCRIDQEGFDLFLAPLPQAVLQRLVACTLCRLLTSRPRCQVLWRTMSVLCFIQIEVQGTDLAVHILRLCARTGVQWSYDAVRHIIHYRAVENPSQ